MPSSIPSDPELLLAHTYWVRSLARRLVTDAGDADDLTQETMLAALRSPAPRSRSAIKSWLGAILKHRWRSRVRAESRRQARERTVARHESESPANDLTERAELHRDIVEAVLELREPFRSTVLLRYFEGLNASQIASQAGVNPATVRSRLRRGVAELRARLDRTHGNRDAWIVAVNALICEWPCPGGAGVATASAATSVASASTSSKSLAGGILMSFKTKAIVGASAAVLLLGGTLFMRLQQESDRSRRLRSQPHETGVAASSSTPRARSDSLRRPLNVKENELPSEAQATLGTISGRVRSESGEVLANVALRAKRLDVPESMLPFVHNGELVISPPSPEDATAETTTDESGSFSFPPLREGLHSVFAWRAGFRMGMVRVVEVKEGHDAPANIVLAPALRIVGVVVDPDGHPVAAAKVSGHLGRAFFTETGGPATHMNWAPPSGQSLDSFRTMSDSQGRFELDGLWPRQHTVIASHPDWAAGRIDGVPAGGGTELVLRLGEGAEVSGTVVDNAGQSVADAIVFVEGGDPRLDEYTQTAPDGSFHLASLAPRTIRLRAWAEGYVSGELERVTLSAAEPLHDVQIVLSAGGALTGVVVDPAGEPIESATVQLRVEVKDGYSFGLNSKTNAEGAYTIRGLIPGEAYVGSARHKDWVPAAIAKFTASDQMVEHEPLLLTTGSILRGRVVDVAGESVPGARVRVKVVDSEHPLHRLHDSRTSLGTDADEDGRFKLSHLGAGDYRVRVRAFGFAHFESEVISLRIGGSQLERDFVLGGGGRVSGEVVLHDGQPLADAEIEIRRTSGGVCARASSDSDGQFLVAGLADDVYKVYASLTDLGSTEAPGVTVGERVRLVLGGQGRIAGRVVDAWSDSPIEAFSVSLVPRSEGKTDMARLLRSGGVEPTSHRFANPDGRFELPPIEAGSYSLVIRADNYCLYRDWDARVSNGKSLKIRAALQPGALLEGRVVDNEGRPVAGARVRMIEDAVSEENVLELSWRTSEGLQYRRLGGRQWVLTDSDGQFALGDLPQAAIQLSVTHDDYLPGEVSDITVVARERTRLRSPIRLRPAARLRGIVRGESGEPTAGAFVRLYRHDASGKETDALDVAVGEDGSFSRRGLEAGRYAVVVAKNLDLSAAEWRRLDRTNVDLKAHQVTELELELSR